MSEFLNEEGNFLVPLTHLTNSAAKIIHFFENTKKILQKFWFLQIYKKIITFNSTYILSGNSIPSSPIAFFKIIATAVQSCKRKFLIRAFSSLRIEKS